MLDGYSAPCAMHACCARCKADGSIVFVQDGAGDDSDDDTLNMMNELDKVCTWLCLHLQSLLLNSQLDWTSVAIIRFKRWVAAVSCAMALSLTT